MKRIITLMAACLIIITGCNKTKEMNLTITEVKNGSLKVKVVDNSNVAIPNIVVKLTNGFSTISEQTTNASGDVSFDKVLEGSYYIQISKVTIGTKTYAVDQIVQVISGNTVNLTINPQSYVATLSVIYTSNYLGNDTIVPNTMVAIFRADDYDVLPNPSFADVMAIAFDSVKTNTDGKVTFTDVPAEVGINLMIYKSANKKSLYLTDFTLTKGEETKGVIYITWNTLF